MSEFGVHLEEMFPLMEEAIAKGGSIRFMPRGTSMLPMLRQGVDSVNLSALPPQKLHKYDLPLYRRKNGQFVLHRIVAVGETYTCVGDNQYELETGIRQEQMLAVVTSFRRGEKEIKVTSFGYRLYCRLWHWTRPVRRIWKGVLWRLRNLP